MKIKIIFIKIVANAAHIILISILSQNVSAQNDNAVNSSSSLQDAVTSGKIDFNIRLRYENVDDDAILMDADALTIRTAIGFTTGDFESLSARILLQDVREIVDNYNDGTGTSVNRTRYPVVADPAETDILEGHFIYDGIMDTSIKLGRQIITFRGAPLHRFVGTVLWRQNWQNYDAISFENKSFSNTTIQYAYVWNVNRIFTEKAAIPGRANFDSNSHMVNIKYSGFKNSTLEAYSYLLDFDNAVTNSTATYGARFSGVYPTYENINILFSAEYALQDDYANNPANVDEDYYLGELGVNFKLNSSIESLTLKVDYEVLAGNGTNSFRTPLATGHAFQGWADRLLTTPSDGIKDLYFSAIAKIFNINFLVVYHDFSSDKDNYAYGTEINVQATRQLYKKFIIGLKYADYNADRNSLNVIRNNNVARDTSKFWAWLQFNY